MFPFQILLKYYFSPSLDVKYYLPPQMFRPLFFVPLAIALVLLQQVLI